MRMYSTLHESFPILLPSMLKTSAFDCTTMEQNSSPFQKSATYSSSHEFHETKRISDDFPLFIIETA